LLLYLINQDQKNDLKRREQEFKNQVFANSIDLYRKMFMEEDVIDEKDVEYVAPQNEFEFKNMLKELKSYGLIDND